MTSRNRALSLRTNSSTPHVHERDLIVLIQEGAFIVDYGDRKDEFGPGDMCYVAPNVKHTDQAGPEGATYLMAWR